MTISQTVERCNGSRTPTKDDVLLYHKSTQEKKTLRTCIEWILNAPANAQRERKRLTPASADSSPRQRKQTDGRNQAKVKSRRSSHELYSPSRTRPTLPTTSSIIQDGTLAALVTAILPPLEDSSSSLPCSHAGSTLLTPRKFSVAYGKDSWRPQLRLRRNN